MSATHHKDVFDCETDIPEQPSLPPHFGNCAKRGCKIMTTDLDGMPAKAILWVDTFPEMNSLSSEPSRAPKWDLGRKL
jgi:hypothetical protein